MQKLDIKEIIRLLKKFSKNKKGKVKVILTGALALQYYGLKRGTINFDAEVSKEFVDELIQFLSLKGIPCDISSDISRWSVVSLPKGYRFRAKKIYEDEKIVLRVMAPVDIVISKLRRFTEEDLQDALYLVRKFNIKKEELQKHIESAIKNSPKDTVIFTFKRNVEEFFTKI